MKKLRLGHYLAITAIAMAPNLVLAKCQSFDVLRVTGEQALVRSSCGTLWVPVDTLVGHAACTVPDKVVAADGIQMVAVPAEGIDG